MVRFSFLLIVILVSVSTLQNKLRLELIYTLLVHYNRFLHNIGTAKRAHVIGMAVMF